MSTLTTFVKPRRLRPGDTVAVVSPSWGGPAIFPGIYELGLECLQEIFHLKIKEYESARKAPDYLYKNPEFRAEDLNRAFADSDVSAIITSIGGDDSMRILPYLDLDTIRANPKIIMGYSDATTFLTVINQKGLVTFNGPAIMAGFAQLKSLPEASVNHIRTLLMESFETYEFLPYDSYSEGYPDWGVPENLGKVNPPQTDGGWVWVQGGGRASGLLFGGCVEVLEFLKATVYWPQTAFWEGKILFLETSEMAMPPDQVRWILRNYGLQGVFDRISALIFGRPRGYTEAQKQQLAEILHTVIGVEFGQPLLPVVANMDFGHTDPQWILPNGVRAEIDCDHKRFRLLEGCTV